MQIGCIKPFSEPAKNLCQQLVSRFTPVVALAQPTQAQRRPEFKRPRVLVAGDVKGLPKARFGR
jgi:hypothetical protein